jgi:hypothetical protein
MGLARSIEYNVSYIYHALWAYFDRDNVALPGLAKFFKDGEPCCLPASLQPQICPLLHKCPHPLLGPPQEAPRSASTPSC